jgi:hypothetical protein
MDYNIERFRLTGRIFLWKFEHNVRNYPGWNFTCDDDGCESMIGLLELMQSSAFPSSKKLTLEQPTIMQVKAAQHCHDFRSAKYLSLHYKKGLPGYWYTEEGESHLRLTFGDHEIVALRRAIYRVKKKEGDFAIGDPNDEHQIYFWWFIE